MAGARKTFFFNISVDRNWQNKDRLKALYPISSPQTRELLHAYQFFAASFAASPQDKIICYRSPAPEFVRYFYNLIGGSPALVEVCEDPLDVESWMTKALSCGACDPTDEFYFASRSLLEEKIAQTSPKAVIHPAGDSQFHARLNRKSLLVNWVREFNILFPRTHGPMPLSETLRAARPSVIKLDQSAGSAGVFVLPVGPAPFARVLERIATPDLTAFEQEFLDIDRHFYTVADVGHGATEVLQCYELWFAGGVSTEHIPLHDEALLRLFGDVAQMLGAKLAQEGYAGPFGFDGISAEGRIYPAIDLNVRVCKSRLFFETLKRCGRAASGVFRHVFLSTEAKTFQTYFQSLQQALPGDRPFLLYWDSVRIAEKRHLTHALIGCAPENMKQLRNSPILRSLEDA